MKTVQCFLIWCAGVTPEALKDCHDWTVTKYTNLGVLVLIPALVAFPAGTYFVLTLFAQDNPNALIWSLIAGFVWAGIVFSIDRYIVMTFTKSDNFINTLFSPKIICRIILAGVISYIVAQPLVLGVFSGNVKESLQKKNKAEITAIIQSHDEKIATHQTEITRLTNENGEISITKPIQAELSGEKKLLLQRIEDKEGEIQDAQNEFADEVAGRSNRTGKKGEGPVAKVIRKKITRLEADLKYLKGQLSKKDKMEQSHFALIKQNLKSEHDQKKQLFGSNIQRIKDERTSIKLLENKKKIAIDEFKRHESYDFLSLMSELAILSQENSTVKNWDRMLTLLLFSIDMIAIFLKIATDPDDYDARRDTATLNDKLQEERARQVSAEISPFKLEYERSSAQHLEKKVYLDFCCKMSIAKLNAVSNYTENLIAEQRQFMQTLKTSLKTVNVDDKLIDEIIRGYEELNSLSLDQVLEAAKKSIV